MCNHAGRAQVNKEPIRNALLDSALFPNLHLHGRFARFPGSDRKHDVANILIPGQVSSEWGDQYWCEVGYVQSHGAARKLPSRLGYLGVGLSEGF